jgi:hypothetical protein
VMNEIAGRGAEVLNDGAVSALVIPQAA